MEEQYNYFKMYSDNLFSKIAIEKTATGRFFYAIILDGYYPLDASNYLIPDLSEDFRQDTLYPNESSDGFIQSLKASSNTWNDYRLRSYKTYEECRDRALYVIRTDKRFKTLCDEVKSFTKYQIGYLKNAAEH